MFQVHRCARARDILLLYINIFKLKHFGINILFDTTSTTKNNIILILKN